MNPRTPQFRGGLGPYLEGAEGGGGLSALPKSRSSRSRGRRREAFAPQGSGARSCLRRRCARAASPPPPAAKTCAFQIPPRDAEAAAECFLLLSPRAASSKAFSTPRGPARGRTWWGRWPRGTPPSKRPSRRAGLQFPSAGPSAEGRASARLSASPRAGLAPPTAYSPSLPPAAKRAGKEPRSGLSAWASLGPARAIESPRAGAVGPPPSNASRAPSNGGRGAAPVAACLGPSLPACASLPASAMDSPRLAPIAAPGGPAAATPPSPPPVLRGREGGRAGGRASEPGASDPQQPPWLGRRVREVSGLPGRVVKSPPGKNAPRAAEMNAPPGGRLAVPCKGAPSRPPVDKGKAAGLPLACLAGLGRGRDCQGCGALAASAAVPGGAEQPVTLLGARRPSAHARGDSCPGLEGGGGCSEAVLLQAAPPCLPSAGAAAPRRPPEEEDPHPWARALRQRLAAQLREVGHAEAGHVAALAAELAAVFQAVLRQSSRRAWLRLMEALRLIGPFQQLLSGRAELAPYLEGLYYQFRSSQALVSDLDVLGAVWRSFPEDCSVLWAAPRTSCPRDPADPAKLLPSSREPVFAGLPCPFATDWEAAGISGMLKPAPVSLQELQRCVGPVGSELAREETPWANSLGLMPLTLAADVPTEYPCAEPSITAGPSLESDKETLRTTPAPKKTAPAVAKDKEPPMTGLQAAEVFAKNRHLGEISFLYLNVAHSRHFRPYDLVAVPKHLINPQHYVFSPYGVLQVHPKEGSEALSLGDWHREAVLWQLMQYIPFFRLFLVRKAFVRWCFNVKHLQRLKGRQTLRLQLLQAVPHFGAALLHISRLLQELRSIHWLPTDDSKCYSFPELKRALDKESSHAQGLLSRFLALCTSIMELVRDDTYKMVHGLQMQVQSYKLYLTNESLYHQRMQYEGLQRQLQEAESWLQRLGFLALLVNFLICQTLVSAMQEDVTAFVHRTMKADGTSRKAVLGVHLVFGPDSQLMLFPSQKELEDCLLGAVTTVVESVLQTTRIRSRSERLENQECLQSVTPEQRTAQTRALDVAGAADSPGQGSSEQLQWLPTTVLCKEEPQLVHRLNLKAFGGLEVVGHRLRGEYPLLSREQLAKDLQSDSIIQKAMALQQSLLTAALMETQLLCREYAWLGQIYDFVHSWSASQLKSMKGWPAEEYVNQILKLRTWVNQVENVPSVVITYNRLLFVDCSGIHQDILPLLDAIHEDILSLLLSETTQRSESLIAELAGILQLYMNVGTDIFTIAKCSQKLEQYQGQMAELQEYVDYVRALNEVIQQCFRPLSPSEECLENTLLDTWDAFVYQQREVSDFIVSRRLSIIAELSSSLQKAIRELQELLATVTVGYFQDPAQNPRAMENELHELFNRFQATVARVTDLCRSQRILTGECMDVSFVTGKQGVIELHARIWQLFRIVSEQVTEWKCLAFVKFSTTLAMEKTEEWQKEVIAIEHCLSSSHPVLQACLRAIANFQKYLPLLLNLGSPLVKLSCWKEIFAVMGVKCPFNMQFTLGQLLSYPLLEHSDAILRVCACEKSRQCARDTVHRLQRAWAEKQFRLVNFILNVPYQEPQTERFRRPASGRQRPAKLEYISKDSGTYVLSDTAELKASVEHSIVTLQNMILSPFSSDIQEEAKSWVSTLRAFESLLDAWVNFQQKWVFLNIVLYEMNISLPSAELDSRFQRVDAHFREFMHVTCNDPLVLSSVRLVPGSSRESRFIGGTLQAAFVDGSGDLQVIVRALDYVLEATRMSFPRLFFLSNEELVALLATASEPADASAWSQRCFPGVRQLQLLMPSAVQNRGMFSAEIPVVQVTGLVGAHGEAVRLCSVVSLSRKATQWLCMLEQRMKESVFNLTQDCVARRLALRPQLDLAFERQPGPTELPLHLVAECWAMLGNSFPNQCVLLAEEALWRVAVDEALVEPGCWPGLELKVSLKLGALAHYVRNYRSVRAWDPDSDSLGMLLGALIVLTVQQRDTLSQLAEGKVSSPRAFAWARRLKYRVALSPEKGQAVGLPPSSPWVGSTPGCWADVLDCRLPYDYEYLGPSLRLLGSPLLDRTYLGMLLALDEFRCSGLLGCPDVGKSHTVQGLAQALGRQLVTLHCTAQMSISCLSRHLCGAVHAGALLLLESAERLEPAVLSAFSQRLLDLQSMCLSLHQSREAAAGLSSATASPASQDSEGSASSEEGEGPPAIPLPELGTDEAEPYQPRVLGNILFGGRLLRVRETYGCVATLERLPEPLCLALRPLAVLPPDLTRLAEVTLLAAGFREAARLAEKLCAFLRLEGELSPGPRRSRPTLVREVIRLAVRILFSPPARRDTLTAKAKPSTRTTFLLGLEEEPAMVKALSASPLLSGPDCPQLHNVRELLREVFPSACSQPYEPQAPPRLQGALVTQLHEDKLQVDPELLRLAGQLSQALLGPPSILLLGPSGSGKTTAWQTLAKAQSRLAASDAVPGAHGPGAPQPTLFRPVSTVCLWPNGLTVAEFVGSLEGSQWQDGVLSRLLQRAAMSTLADGSSQGSRQQWLVLDGATSAEWLEPISSLFSTRPSLSLPNGQRLQTPENVRFLFEMPDASGMPPSVCAHCALLYCGGSQLWRVLLSSALAHVYRKYSVTQESLAMLHELAEELFPPTLAFLQQHCCSVLLPHSHPQSPMAQGVQEVTAFTRIFQALLEQYLRRDRIKHTPAAPEQTAEAKAALFAAHSSIAPHSLDDSVPAHHHLLAQSIFVFAYIWGFGSHLHPRHWPPFDRFVHRALHNSRFSIRLPSAASAFDLRPLAENGTLEPFDGRYLSSRVKGIPVSFSVLPQYERVLFVTDLLLGSGQPLLLVGEPGCGKSSFAEMLVQPNHFYHRVCLTPALRATHLRRLLHKKSLGTVRDKGLFPMGKVARGTVSKGRCLFLVEDLHLALVDPVRGSSPVIESLRQALSHHQFYHAETLELQHWPAAGFNCFGTLSVPLAGAPPLCPRFSRLLSIVVLPVVTRESLVSMHIGSVLAWLEKFPLLTRHCDLASALVRATVDTYEAARSRFQPSPACCLFRFSLHDIQKVIKGLFVLRPRPGIHLSSPLEDHSSRASTRRASGQSKMATGTGYTMVLSTRLTIRLWMHECLRVFGDPLRGEHQRDLCGQMVLEIATATFCARRPFLRVVASLGGQTSHLPSRGHIAFRLPSTSSFCLAPGLEDEEVEEAEPREEDLLAMHAEPDLPDCCEVDRLDPWDPVEQAPALSLSPLDPSPYDDPSLGELENEPPAEAELEEVGVGKKRSGAFPEVNPEALRGTHAPRASPHSPAFVRFKRRASSKKESAGPLLPSHLLLLPSEAPRDLVFSKDLGPDAYGPSAYNPYQEKQWKALEGQLTRWLPPDFLPCSEGLRHVVRLSRLLCGPDRHGALVSFVRCTGRQALVALAARATASLLIELPATADEAEATALLRLASWQAGITGKRVLLLVHSGVSLASLHLVLALMAEGTCPGLYSPEESVSVIQALLQENQSIKRTMRDDLILQRFFQFVRSNLHVLLLLGGPCSRALPPLLATALAQMLCSLEIYQPWSYTCLLKVALRHLKHYGKRSAQLTREPTSLHANKDLLRRIAKAAALIHTSVTNYATFLAAHLPLVSPKSLLDFLDTFVVVLNVLQEQNNKQTERMKLALHNMGEVSKKQQEHTRDVHFLQQKLVRIKEQVAHNQREVEREQEVLKQQEAECQQYEAHIDALTKERDELEKGKELAMKKVSKDYQAALAVLRVQDIEELRSYRQPPSPVVQVTDILCMMFHQEPGWENAKLLLGGEDFYQELVFYPKDNLPTELFRALGLAVHDKAFSAATIRNASQAAAAVYQWILAVYWYHWALRDWQPAILQMQQCDDQINSEKINLGDRRLHAEYLRNATQTRIRELTLKQERREKLLQQLTQSLQAKEEATTVESSVAEHMVNWTTLTKGLEYRHSTMHGDALLCAGVLSYLGPFPPPRREELLEKWQALCAGFRVFLGPDDIGRILQKDLPCPGSASFGPPLLAVQKPFVLSSLLSSTQEQRLWDRVHKPKDPESRLVAMILHSKTHTGAHRWPLLVDPDRQALVWLLMAPAVENEESQAYVLSDLVPDTVEQGGFDEIPEDKLEILSLTAPDLDQSLRNAASQGSPVLLTDFEKNVPWCLALQQLMQKESFRGTEDTVLLPQSEEKKEEEEDIEGEEGNEKVLVPPSFQLYLCTELPLEALAAEIDHVPLKSLNVIDLSLSQGALEDLLLVEVVRAERREGLTNLQALHLGVLQLEGKLEATEEELVALISQPQRSLLEEENFLPMMQLLQTQIQALRATHRHMVSQYQDQAALCDKYRQVARLGVGLHQGLQQVCRLHPLYRFPTALCIHRVRQALLSAKHQESSKQESLETRLLELNKAVLQQLLTQALPCLREADRPLYTFLGALATLRAAGDVSPLEWLAFCQGLREPAAMALLRPEASVPRPGWVREEAWQECALLEALPGFQGLLASLASKAAQWQEYFRLPSTVVGLALCPSHTHLRPFQRAILWRILCPGATSSVMADLTACLLGWSLTEEMTAIHPSAYSRANKPVIFLTPAAESPGSVTTHPLLWIQQMAAQRGRAGRVVVISFGTPDASRRVWRALPLCTKKGKWLVLNNCHLQESWDPDVLTLLEAVLSTQAGETEGGALEIHPKFRLWLITAADAPDSVPGLVHRNATTLFCEMPMELKNILAYTHRQLQGQAQNLDTETQLPLLVLYGVMLYRQAYAQWSQAAAYLWSHGEVLAGLRAQEKLSRLTDSPKEALQELAGTILYGGHVLDEGDAQAVQSLCQQCLSPAFRLQPGIGLQSLLALVVGCPSPGLSEEEAAAATQARIEQLPSPMEPAWVGLCSGLQREMLACRSRVLFSALRASQGLWQLQDPPGSQQQEALEQLLQEGLLVVQELQEQLVQCGWQAGARSLPPQGQPRLKPRPLQRFLLEEGGSFLALLKQVGRDLCCAQERLQGASCPSRRCLATLQDLQGGRLPRPWLAYAPTGPQSPQAWLETLQRRGQLLCCYLSSIGGPPVAHYQLAAFHRPRRLFLALLQEKARVEKQELDRYQLEQQVLPSVLPPSGAPEQGIYLHGLEVHNAMWNTRHGHLQETLSAQPCRLPTIWMQASRQPWKPASALAVYRCPLYLGAPGEPVSLSSSRVLLHLALPSKMSPDLCAQRRVHVVSLLQ
ncbi:dynein heavy chain domain-containing protein 1 [Elgaria multicarinata webbii]|uniref:dynein heavy chain domain-containing protein 1 n=1 Tax=Elgaria multicarinata webbii TaxID=159646 RepID=UPI002FCD14D8